MTTYRKVTTIDEIHQLVSGRIITAVEVISGGKLVTCCSIIECGLKCKRYMQITIEVSKGAKIRNRYYQVPHLTQDTNGKVTNSQLVNTNESQEVSPFPAGDHKAHINRRAQRHSKHKTEQKHERSAT